MHVRARARVCACVCLRVCMRAYAHLETSVWAENSNLYLHIVTSNNCHYSKHVTLLTIIIISTVNVLCQIHVALSTCCCFARTSDLTLDSFQRQSRVQISRVPTTHRARRTAAWRPAHAQKEPRVIHAAVMSFIPPSVPIMSRPPTVRDVTLH